VDSDLKDLNGAHGTVALSDWGRDPYGRGILVVTGALHFHTAEGSLKFRPSSKDSNWFIEVRGETESYFVPGCKVSGVIYHKPKTYNAGGSLHPESLYLVP